MPTQYNRLLCGFCPIKDRCDEIRWFKRCGTCQHSLTCTAGPGLGHVDCTLIGGDWRSLPSTCLIARNRLAVYAKSGNPEEAFQTREMEGRAPQMVCPRCNEATASKEIAMEMTPAFRMEKVARLKCSRCGLDETSKL